VELESAITTAATGWLAIAVGWLVLSTLAILGAAVLWIEYLA